MDSAESARRLLHEQAVRALGPEAAAVLMEHLPPAGWSDLARRSDVEHSAALLRADVTAEFAAVRGEMAAEFAAVRGEMAGLRAELHAVIAGQTRWMVTVLALLGAIYTAVTVLAR